MVMVMPDRDEHIVMTAAGMADRATAAAADPLLWGERACVSLCLSHRAASSPAFAIDPPETAPVCAAAVLGGSLRVA
jgi:hypothetical protein